MLLDLYTCSPEMSEDISSLYISVTYMSLRRNA